MSALEVNEWMYAHCDRQTHCRVSPSLTQNYDKKKSEEKFHLPLKTSLT